MAEASLIFISYRRDDSADITGRIYDGLVQRCGKAAIFRDIDAIPLGVDFRAHIDQMVAQCGVLLAVIGPDWVNIKDSAGVHRLDDPGDFVRIEIESALARQIPVIPLLVRAATMPQEADLPESLKALAYRNAIQIRRDPDFHHDLDRLIDGLASHLPELGIFSESPDGPVASPNTAGPTFNLSGNIQAAQMNMGGTQTFQESIEVDMRETHLHQPQGQVVMGDKIEMSGDFQGAMLNLKSRLENVSQTINAISGDDASKQELLKLIQDLKAILENVPAQKIQQAESVSKRVEALAREVAEEQPDAEMLAMTGQSLKRAAKNLGELLPMLIPLATQIVNASLKFSGF